MESLQYYKSHNMRPPVEERGMETPHFKSTRPTIGERGMDPPMKSTRPEPDQSLVLLMEDIMAELQPAKGAHPTSAAGHVDNVLTKWHGQLKEEGIPPSPLSQGSEKALVKVLEDLFKRLG